MNVMARIQFRQIVLSTGIAVAAAVVSLAAHANPAHDIISGMSEGNRKETFAALLSRGGEKCPTVSRTFYQGSDSKGDAFWNASCVGGQSWLVQVSNDAQGSTRVMSCTMLKAMNAGTCFTKLK